MAHVRHSQGPRKLFVTLSRMEIEDWTFQPKDVAAILSIWGSWSDSCISERVRYFLGQYNRPSQRSVYLQNSWWQTNNQGVKKLQGSNTEVKWSRPTQDSKQQDFTLSCKKIHPLTFIDACLTFIKTQWRMWAKSCGIRCVSTIESTICVKKMDRFCWRIFLQAQYEISC